MIRKNFKIKISLEKNISIQRIKIIFILINNNKDFDLASKTFKRFSKKFYSLN